MNKDRLTLGNQWKVCFRSILNEAANHSHSATQPFSWWSLLDVSSPLGLLLRPPHSYYLLKIWHNIHPCLYSSGLILSLLRVNYKRMFKVENETKPPLSSTLVLYVCLQ